MERGTLLSDAGDYDVFPRGVGVLSLMLHSFGNKLLFWPQRLLWARAVEALAAKRGREEERRYSARLVASAQLRRQAGDRPSRLAPLRLPRPSSPPPHRRGALQPPHPFTLRQQPLQLRAEFLRTERGRRARRLGPPPSPLAKIYVYKIGKFFQV